MGCAVCRPCEACGHAIKWELTEPGKGCQYPVRRWRDTGDGPGYEHTEPCGCTATQREVFRMTTPQPPADSGQQTAAALGTAAEMMRKMHHAYSEFDQALSVAHNEWQQAANAAHRRLADRLAIIAGVAEPQPPFGRDGGPT